MPRPVDKYANPGSGSIADRLRRIRERTEAGDPAGGRGKEFSEPVKKPNPTPSRTTPNPEIGGEDPYEPGTRRYERRQ